MSAILVSLNIRVANSKLRHILFLKVFCLIIGDIIERHLDTLVLRTSVRFLQSEICKKPTQS